MHVFHQPEEGDKADDISTLQVAMHCCNPKHWAKDRVPLKLNDYAISGAFTYQKCPQDSFIVDMRVQSEPYVKETYGMLFHVSIPMPYDNTALNGIWFKCQNSKRERTDWVLNYRDKRGTWGKWSTPYRYEQNYYACGAEVKQMPYSSSERDNVGVTGFKVAYCKYN